MSPAAVPQLRKWRTNPRSSKMINHQFSGSMGLIIPEDWSQSDLLKVTRKSVTIAVEKLESDRYESKSTTEHQFWLPITAFRNPEQTALVVTSLIPGMQQHKHLTSRQEKLQFCKVPVTLQWMFFKLWGSVKCFVPWWVQAKLSYIWGWKLSLRHSQQNIYCGVNLPCGN